jgi:peptide/nickel transport system permease protein
VISGALTLGGIGRGMRSAAARARRLPLVPVAIMLAMVLTASFAEFLAPHNPYETNLPMKGRPPFWVQGGSTEHLLGTDLVGRDVLSRMIFGARVTLLVVLAGIALAGILGTVFALLAGYLGGVVDAVIMRVVDATLALPIILLAMLLAAVLGPSLSNLIYIIAVVLWSRYCRVVRAEVMVWKQRDFVAYAKVAGTSTFKIIVRHVFLNVVNSLMVLITVQTGQLVLMEAGLSFLGAGVPPPTPSWGGMVAAGRDYIVSAWWLSLFPGLAIALVVLALNLFGDWLRDHLDPKLRQV